MSRLATFARFTLSDGRVGACHYDEHHESEGSFAYDTEAETQAAVDEEIENLNSGKWIVWGFTTQSKPCGECGERKNDDSCWGHVTTPDEATIREMLVDVLGPIATFEEV